MLLISIILFSLNIIGINQFNFNPQDDKCDNPDADTECYFKDMPSNLTSTMKITETEKGAKLNIKGKLVDHNNKPISDVVIYAYHTDRNGIYPKRGNEKGVRKWHGYLHGFCKTDKDGNFEIQTIRPAQYPSNNAPAHIHMAVKIKNKPYLITDIHFEGDKLLKGINIDKMMQSSWFHNTDTGIIKLKENKDGSFTGERTIKIKKL